MEIRLFPDMNRNYVSTAIQISLLYSIHVQTLIFRQYLKGCSKINCSLIGSNMSKADANSIRDISGQNIKVADTELIRFVMRSFCCLGLGKPLIENLASSLLSFSPNVPPATSSSVQACVGNPH